MDLTFQVLIQYCSLQHWTLLPLPVTSTTGHCFHCGFLSSFFLELFSHSSPVAYGVPIDWGVHLSLSHLFAFPYCSWGFKARILMWFTIPFSSGPQFVKSLHHDPSELVTLYGMVHSFIELDKAVVHVISLVSFLWLWFSFCLPSEGKGKEAYGNFLMGETAWGVNWVLFW